MLFKNRTVIDVEVDGIDLGDYPDFCDAYFSSAVWEDTGEFLTDDELCQLTEVHIDKLYEMIQDTIVGMY